MNFWYYVAPIVGIVALIVAGIDYFVEIDLIYQILIWAVCSGLLLLLVRPLLLKNKKDTDEDSGINAKYIGKEAKTIMPTGKEDGRVTIYGEDWFARSIDGNEIEKDVVVKIVKCENSILYVEKI